MVSNCIGSNAILFKKTKGLEPIFKGLEEKHNIYDSHSFKSVQSLRKLKVN